MLTATLTLRQVQYLFMTTLGMGTGFYSHNTPLLFLFSVRQKSLDTLFSARGGYLEHVVEHSLHSFILLTAEMAFANLGSHQFTCAGIFEAF
jgi:hypothetical protein